MQILRHSKIAVTMEIYTEVPSAATREAASSHSGLTRTRSLLDPIAALCCCTKIKTAGSQVRNRPLSWVGDTGIEPVTSSV
jgi:hypothetical protein